MDHRRALLHFHWGIRAEPGPLFTPSSNAIMSFIMLEKGILFWRPKIYKQAFLIRLLCDCTAVNPGLPNLHPYGFDNLDRGIAKDVSKDKNPSAVRCPPPCSTP